LALLVKRWFLGRLGRCGPAGWRVPGVSGVFSDSCIGLSGSGRVLGRGRARWRAAAARGGLASGGEL